MKELFNMNNIVFLTALTYIISQSKDIIKWIFKQFIVRTRMGILIQENKMKISELIDWIKLNSKYPKDIRILENNIFIGRTADFSNLNFGYYVIKIDRFTWMLIWNWYETSAGGLQQFFNCDILGKNRDKYFQSMKDYLLPNKKENIIRFTAGVSVDDIDSVLIDKVTDKKIFGSHVVQIEHIIDGFLKKKDIYDRFGKKFKLNILLYGNPGTGKTSIIKYIANKFKFEKVHYIDKMFARNDDSCIIYNTKNIIEWYEKTGKPSLLIIEDIDKSVLKIGGDNEENENKPKKIVGMDGYIRNAVHGSLTGSGEVLNNLMQFLDSNTSPNGAITIITTNNKQYLPEPLIRPGRLDYMIEIGNISSEEAKEMVKFYGSDIEIEDHDYNPAELENRIFQEMISKE
jgi:ATPases of the AAA+ class